MQSVLMIFYEEIKFTAYLSHFSTKTTYENNLHPIRHFQLIQNFSRNRTFFYSLEVFKILKLILLVIFIYCISFQPLFPTSEFFFMYPSILTLGHVWTSDGILYWKHLENHLFGAPNPTLLQTVSYCGAT